MFARVSSSEHRTIIEFCCGEESLLGKLADKNCTVHRVTIENDVTTPEGMAHVLKLIENCNPHRTLLFASMPCTGGSPWMNLNRRYPGGAAKLRIHLRIFKRIWSCFAKCAMLLKSLGGHICIECPTACAYWRWKCVENLVEMLGLKSVKVHGCALGLKSVVNSMPIKKPWTLKTDVPTIVEELEKYKCPGDHEHHPCAGKDTKLTESYTPEMVAVIHGSFKQFLSKERLAVKHQHVNAAAAIVLKKIPTKNVLPHVCSHNMPSFCSNQVAAC